MKEMINHYYGLRINNVSYNGKYYIADDCNSKYMLKELNDSTLDLNVISQLDKYKYFFKIKKNNGDTYVTTINNKNYVLLIINNFENYKISLYDIKTDYYLMPFDNIYKSWIMLWEQKVDFFEKCIDLKKEQFYDLLPMFEYYIGIAENAILMLKKVFNKFKNTLVNFSAVHKRLNESTTIYEYYDPTEIICDYSVRDIAEYVKSTIVTGSFEIDMFDNYLSKIKLSDFEVNLLFARILFPTVFFDYADIKCKEKLQFLETIIKKYEDGIIAINELLSKKYGIERVEWLFKK